MAGAPDLSILLIAAFSLLSGGVFALPSALLLQRRCHTNHKKEMI